MKKITYKFEGADLIELGKIDRTCEGNLVIILSAKNPETAEEKINALGNLNTAEIYLDNKQINYRDLFKQLMSP